MTEPVPRRPELHVLQATTPGSTPDPAPSSGADGVAPGLARRVLDLVVAGTALVLATPALGLIALCVKLSSRGPVIFRQERVGQGGKPFTVFKVRSMRCDQAGPEVTPSGDPRVTWVGRFLRATSLDELPQLVNVLRGDMTLVGPRPETPELAHRYPEGCAEVFRYRPGLTGPAQLRTRDARILPVDAVDVERYYLQRVVPRRVALDLEYLARPTLARTLAVLVATAVHVLSAGRVPRAEEVPPSSTHRERSIG